VSIIATGATWPNVTARGAADRALKPGDLVSGARRVAHPAHQAHVILVQPVAEGDLHGVHIDSLARQQVADPRGPRGAAVPQPVLPFLRIGCDHLLGYLVDVTRHELEHAQRGGAHHLGVRCLPGQFLEQPVGEARVPDPVGAQQAGPGVTRYGGLPPLAVPPLRRRPRY
jgi:hypothetical protein